MNHNPEHLRQTAENLRSIDRVLVAHLPANAPARILLTAATSLGCDCYCCHSDGPNRVWCAWIEDRRIPLADSYHVTAYALAALNCAIGEELAVLRSTTTTTSSSSSSSSSSNAGIKGEGKEQPR